VTNHEEQQQEQLQMPQQEHNMRCSTPKCGIHHKIVAMVVRHQVGLFSSSPQLLSSSLP
jgi:hypothetical protein